MLPRRTFFTALVFISFCYRHRTAVGNTLKRYSVPNIYRVNSRETRRNLFVLLLGDIFSHRKNANIRIAFTTHNIYLEYTQILSKFKRNTTELVCFVTWWHFPHRKNANIRLAFTTHNCKSSRVITIDHRCLTVDW